ncbi:MAG: deoxyribonuclease IV [Chloroflexota bacterium]
MRIGAHVSTAGGLDKAIDRGLALEAEAVQIFGSAPQSWALKPHPSETISAFRAKAAEAGVSDAVFLHGVYLVNLATENELNLARGIDSLVYYLDLAGAIGGRGVIFHVGSHKGAGFDAVLPQITAAINEVLRRAGNDAWLIIENNAGQGNQVGGNFREIRRIMDSVANPRMRVCLDTQHSFASGYDMATEAGLAATMAEFGSEIGFENLVAVHANDSKTPLGAAADRHENIGEGYIGYEGFRRIVGHPAFRDVPFLLEVPGLERQGPDLENMGRLKDMRAAVGR